MFDSICFRCKSDNILENYLNLGTLAEALLFYQKVILVIRWDSAEKLVTGCGPEPLLELINGGFLEVVYEQNMSGIRTNNSQVKEIHSPIIVEGDKTVQHSPQHIFPRLFTKAVGRRGKGRRLANKFLQGLKMHRHEPSQIRPVIDDWKNTEYVEQVIAEILQYYAPEYHQDEPVKFQIHKEDERYYVETNIDLVRANASYHKRIPPTHSSLTQAYLLTNLLTIQENLNFAAHYSSELITNPFNARLFQARIGQTMHSCKPRIETIGLFQEKNFDNSRALADTINSEERSFSDLMILLSKAERFRSWLHKQDPDADLLREYIQEISGISWLEKTPYKIMRWAFFTGAGAIADLLGAGGTGTVAGLGISVLDEFILEKLIQGWRPNQFLHGPYKKFVKK